MELSPKLTATWRSKDVPLLSEANMSTTVWLLEVTLMVTGLSRKGMISVWRSGPTNINSVWTMSSRGKITTYFSMFSII